jgi:hypothetical protein
MRGFLSPEKTLRREGPAAELPPRSSSSEACASGRPGDRARRPRSWYRPGGAARAGAPRGARPRRNSATRLSIWSTPRGAMDSRSDGEPHARSRDSVRHWTLCARLAVVLEGNERGYRVWGEPQLRAAEHAAGQPIASATLGTLPDGRPRLPRAVPTAARSLIRRARRSWRFSRAGLRSVDAADRRRAVPLAQHHPDPHARDLPQLAVNSRADAVARADALGLLSEA